MSAFLIVFGMTGLASAATTVSGVGDPTASLVIDPGSPTGAVESSDLNFYTGDDVFHITSMPDTRRIDGVTLGPVARGDGCERANIRLYIYEAEPALQPRRVISESPAFTVALPERPENLEFDVQPVTLRKGRAYAFHLKHGGTTCVVGKRLTWPHNEPQVNAGTAMCSFMPFHYLQWYRVWHVQGLNDLPSCPYDREPTNFEPQMPTGWLAVQQSYPNWLVDYETTYGIPPVPPDCDTGESYGKEAYYWKEHPTLPNRHLWACTYTQFPDPLLGIVPDGWYYAGPWNNDFSAAPRDMYLELHPVDYGSLKDAHAPTYAFDEDEDFFPQRASAFTANWVEAPGGVYLPHDDYANLLLGGADEMLAAAGSPETLGMPPELLLGELAADYGFDGSASSTDDYINARGGDLATYQSDSNNMRALGHADARYDRVVYDPDDGKLWVQYWLFYYYNSFATLGIGEHEGDWEMVQVGFDSAQQPDAITFASHDSAYGCTWAEAELAVGSSPIVYVAAKSHASYPHAGSTDLFPILATDQHRGTGFWSLEPGEDITGYAWPTWRGRWGASRTGTFQSPVNISQQGDKWDRPSKFHNDHLDPETC